MNVFIVEGSAILLERLRHMLSVIPGVVVIGHAVDEAGAIERIDKLRPDVVTLDIRLQSGSGLRVLENIKKHHAEIKVMVLTNCAEKAYANRCKRGGTDYFFDKTLQIDQFCEVLREWAHIDRQPNHGEIPFDVPEQVLIWISESVAQWGNYPLTWADEWREGAIERVR